MDATFPLENSSERSLDETIHTQNETAKPVDAVSRIKTIDVIRGVALFGILLMNIPGFGIDWGEIDKVRRGLQTTWDFRTLQVVSVFFEGTMRGLFSMLFGAGMILFTMNKTEAPGGPTIAELYYRRLLLLVLFGVINAYVLLWTGDILFFYGIAGMVLYPFRKTAAKWLILLSIAAIAIGMIKTQLWHNETLEKRVEYRKAVKAEKEGNKLTEEQKQAKAAWLEMENFRPEPERSARNISKMHSDYGTIFTYFIPRNSGTEAWGGYHGIWDSLCMMFLGMALFQLGFFSNRLSTSTYLMGLIVGYGMGIPIGWTMFFEGDIGSLNMGRYFDAYTSSHWSLYDLKRVFLCLGHASLVILIFRSRIVPWLMRGLANVGQMAFTNYLMQSIICTFFFFGYGFGYYNDLSYHQLYYVVSSVWIFQLIISSIWLRYYRFGPFEWLWRSLTYWKAQPMRK